MAEYDLLLQGGSLYDPADKSIRPGDLAVKAGRLAKKAEHIPAESAQTVVDAAGCVISPGLIDLHCHIFPVFPYPREDSLRTTNA